MAENPKEWPRVHTCLNNWCPEQRDDCGRCDAIVDILRKFRPASAETSHPPR